MGPETRYRAQRARAVVKQLRNIWRSRTLSRTLKRRFFNTLVIPVMVYNAETWELGAHEMKFMEKEYMNLAREAMREQRRYDAIAKVAESNAAFLRKHKFEDIGRIIARRKGVWIGHIWRSKDVSFRERMQRLRRRSGRTWWTHCGEEFGKYGTSIEEVLEKVNNPLEKIRKLFDASDARSVSDQ